jgi:hypothetical protein
MSKVGCHSRIGLVIRNLPPCNNEITAIPALLAVLDLTGCIVTIDGIGRS